MALSVQRITSRLWTIAAGTVMVVTDLHGDWDAYCRYRDRFLELRERGEADGLVIAGDVVHRKHEPDDSLRIVLDIRSLKFESPGDSIIYLCGNHELPHIYHFPLVQGETDQTSSFEHAMVEQGCHSEVVGFFNSLPFFLRTAAGVSITHAGASAATADREQAEKLFRWSHHHYAAWVYHMLSLINVYKMREYYEMVYGMSYDELLWHFLAIKNPETPLEYFRFLFGQFAVKHSSFDPLWDCVFTRCEESIGVESYQSLVRDTLQNLSERFVPQRVLVAGHMNVSGGYDLIGDYHFRMASAKNASPREAGVYLLFDAACPVQSAADLEACVHGVF